MECSVGRELARDFALAARRYANTVAKLGCLSTATLNPAEVHRAQEETLRRAGDALREAEAARLALEAHIEQHRQDHHTD